MLLCIDQMQSIRPKFFSSHRPIRLLQTRQTEFTEQTLTFHHSQSFGFDAASLHYPAWLMTLFQELLRYRITKKSFKMSAQTIK